MSLDESSVVLDVFEKATAHVTNMKGRDMEDVLDDLLWVLNGLQGDFARAAMWIVYTAIVLTVVTWCGVILVFVLCESLEYLFPSASSKKSQPIPVVSGSSNKGRLRRTRLSLLRPSSPSRNMTTTPTAKTINVADAQVDAEMRRRGLCVQVFHMESEEEREEGCKRVFEVISGAYGRDLKPWFFR